MANDEITRRQLGHMATRLITGGALAMNLDYARIPDVTLTYKTDDADKTSKKKNNDTDKKSKKSNKDGK